MPVIFSTTVVVVAPGPDRDIKRKESLSRILLRRSRSGNDDKIGRGGRSVGYRRNRHQSCVAMQVNENMKNDPGAKEIFDIFCMNETERMLSTDGILSGRCVHSIYC